MDKLNILADSMGKHLVLGYTNHLIHCYRHHKGFNAVYKSTVNPAFFILQPNRTKIQRIKQGTKKYVKWKEARQHQTKQCPIMLDRLPKDKE